MVLPFYFQQDGKRVGFPAAPGSNHKAGAEMGAENYHNKHGDVSRYKTICFLLEERVHVTHHVFVLVPDGSRVDEQKLLRSTIEYLASFSSDEDAAKEWSLPEGPLFRGVLRKAEGVEVPARFGMPLHGVGPWSAVGDRRSPHEHCLVVADADLLCQCLAATNARSSSPTHLSRCFSFGAGYRGLEVVCGADSISFPDGSVFVGNGAEDAGVSLDTHTSSYQRVKSESPFFSVDIVVEGLAVSLKH